MNASLAGRAVVAGFVLLTGCYHYVPVAPAELEPGGELRVDLGDRGTAELARWIGPRGASITGRVTAVGDSGVTLAVTDVTRINGSTEPWRGEPVLVPRDYAERWRTRHFDRKRTWLVGAGTVAVLMAIDLALGADGFIPGLGGGDRTGSGK